MSRLRREPYAADRSLTCWENEKQDLQIVVKTISQGQLKVYETTTVVLVVSLRAVAVIRFRTSEKVGKGEWWMPRLLQAMKDVISCEKLR